MTAASMRAIDLQARIARPRETASAQHAMHDEAIHVPPRICWRCATLTAMPRFRAEFAPDDLRVCGLSRRAA
jgi:hypothetical protein